jgi:hypothetical protein
VFFVCAVTTKEIDMPNPKALTARELVAARKASTPAPIETPDPETRRAVTINKNQDYRSRYLDEVAPAGIAGRLIKWTKDGTYVTADDGEELAEGAEFIVLADETLVGWIKFAGPGEPPERHMGLLFDGFEMLPREELGDLEQSRWEMGLDNAPADPWLHQMSVVLQNVETRELFTFTTSSKTGRRAVGNLLRHFTRMAKTHPDELPVVRLGKGGYDHRDSRVGWVAVPVFVVVGRAPRDGTAKPDTSVGKYIDDELPASMR